MAQLSVNAHSSSGSINHNGAVWATIRGAGTGTAVVTTGGDNFVVGELSGDYAIYRCFLKFDTSSLPDDAIITSVTLKLYQTSKDTSDNFNIAFTGHTAPDTTLAVEDFDAITLNTPTEYASRTPNVSIVPDGIYSEYSLNANGIAAISKTGYTKIALRHEHDIDNITPTARSYASFDESDDANPPQLVINYSLPVEGYAFFM